MSFTLFLHLLLHWKKVAENLLARCGWDGGHARASLLLSEDLYWLRKAVRVLDLPMHFHKNFLFYFIFYKESVFCYPWCISESVLYSLFKVLQLLGSSLWVGGNPTARMNDVSTNRCRDLCNEHVLVICKSPTQYYLRMSVLGKLTRESSGVSLEVRRVRALALQLQRVTQICHIKQNAMQCLH